MCFTVVGQHISLPVPVPVVSDTRQYLFASFACGDEWEGLVRLAVFTGLRAGVSASAEKNAHTVCTVPLDENGRCRFPEEVLSSAFSAIRVGLVGYSADGQTRLTTDTCTIRQTNSCFYTAVTPTPPAPDLYAEMLAAANSAKTLAETLTEQAANGEFDGRDGTDGLTPYIGANGHWYIGSTDTRTPAKGESGMIPRTALGVCTTGYNLSPNVLFCFTLGGNSRLGMVNEKSDFDNEWAFEVTQGDTAYELSLPTIRWGLGVAPTFAANTTTLCRLYKVNGTLCGEWVSV